MKMRLLDYGAKDRFFIHSIYEAIAVKGVENTIHFCYPERPYVSLGVHQVIESEINGDYCKENGFPFIRRDVGGGAVFLDDGQQFYHLVIKKEDCPADIPSFYEKFLNQRHLKNLLIHLYIPLLCQTYLRERILTF